MSELVTAARPYARAAFESARAHDTLERWSQGLAGLATVVSDATVRRLIGNPRCSARQIGDVIAGILGGVLDEHLQNFVRLLVVSRRLELAADIATLFERSRAKEQHTNMIEIVSAGPLDDAERAALCSAIEARTGRKTVATCRVDPSLLGGASVRVGDLVIDGSLRSRLEKLSQTLAH